MNMFTAKSRIAFGQVCLLSCILLLAILLGIVPDRHQAMLQSRAQLCEAIAINSAAQISRKDASQLDAVLHAVVNRNSDLMSAGIRGLDGGLVVEAGDHAAHWHRGELQDSIDSQFHVTLREGQEKWGQLECRFVPLTFGGFVGWISDPRFQLIVFVSAMSMLVFSSYLGRMLKRLAPSQVVPERVQMALDTLAEGLLIVDSQGQIVLANQAFARAVDVSCHALVGRNADTFGWNNALGESYGDTLPWKSAMEQAVPQPKQTIALLDREKMARVFVVSSTPIMGHDEKCRGAIISFDDITELENAKKALAESKQIAVAADADAYQANNEVPVQSVHDIHDCELECIELEGEQESLAEFVDAIEITRDPLERRETVRLAGNNAIATEAEPIVSVVGVRDEQARDVGDVCGSQDLVPAGATSQSVCETSDNGNSEDVSLPVATTQEASEDEQLDVILSTTTELCEVAQACAAPDTASTVTVKLPTTANSSLLADTAPLRSSLSTEDAEICAIVVEWVSLLREQLTAIHNADGVADDRTLAKLARWLKESATTVGFVEFVDPAATLQAMARREDAAAVRSALKVIDSLAQRIELPQHATKTVRLARGTRTS